VSLFSVEVYRIPDQYGFLSVKAGGQTPQVSFHPSRDMNIQSEADDVAVDLESAKRDNKLLKKYVRGDLSFPFSS
jgi:hypothetical protein